MDFSEADIEKFLPLYYDSETRERIKSGLNGFYANRGKNFEYPEFYTTYSPEYLLQSDILNSVRTIFWNDQESDFVPIFSSGMLISNTCDVSQENVRNINEKQALIAPLIELNSFFNELKENGYNDNQVKELHQTLKDQRPSNIIYLPENFINGKEYLVWLDKISWLPSAQLSGGYDSIGENRFISLSNWAFYLFLFKITFHFARLGEEKDGRAN